MNKIRFFPSRILSIMLMTSFIAVLLAACVPPAASKTVNPPVLVPSLTPDNSLQVTAAATEAIAPTAYPLATSRGPNLEATDPGMVKLASGGLQLVEFFRFT
jgi:hypothetical protein